MFTAYYQSPVGLLIIKTDGEYVNAISFSEESFPPAGNEQLSTLQQKCIRQLDEYFSGKRKIFDLPIKQSGTDFQIKVWHQLAGIPYGKTISYMDLAKKLGDVKVIRAAGTANGKNNLAVVCPCHRVIGSDHKLVGYAGGLWRKNGCSNTKPNIIRVCSNSLFDLTLTLSIKDGEEALDCREQIAA